MGISAEQHRICIGLFHCCTLVSNQAVCSKSGCHGLSRQLFSFVVSVLYLYILLHMLLLILDINNENTVIGIVYYTPMNTPQDFRCISLLNLKTCALLLTLFLKYISRFECEDTNDIFILLGKIASKSTSRLINVVGTTINHTIRTSSIFLLAFLCLLNFKLIDYYTKQGFEHTSIFFIIQIF